MSKALALAACLLAPIMMPSPAHAVSVDDYLRAGYTVVRITSYPGVFQGCLRGQSLYFADGSSFICATNHTQALFAPRVYILRNGSEPVSAVLIGSQVYGGHVSRLGERRFPSPIPVDPTPPPEATPSTASRGADTLIRPIEPVESINQIQTEASLPLNNVQNLPLPKPFVPKRDE